MPWQRPERHTPEKVPAPPIGDNNPPSPIDFARDTIAELGHWMADHPVVQTDEDARAAKLLIDRAKTALEAVETDRDGKVRPLNAEVNRINAEYKAMHNIDAKKPGTFDKVFAELKRRVETFLLAEEYKRQQAARQAAEAARKAEDAAREAEARERDAIENARAGEIGVNIAIAVEDAETAFKAFEQAERVAEIAHVDTRFKIGGGFQKPIGLRTKRVLSLIDLDAAIKDIGLTEGIREAVLSSARDFKKLRGVYPKGVVEVEERVL